jgi:hypothetical protein
MKTTSGSGLAALSACTLVELVRTRRVSPVDIIDDLLARLDVVEPKLNAFVVVDRDSSKKAARAAETAVMRGDPLGALHGVQSRIYRLLLACRRVAARACPILCQLPPTRWPSHDCELWAPSLSERQR